VLGIKYYLSIDRLEIIRYEIAAERRYLNRQKIKKIICWLECRNVIEV